MRRLYPPVSTIRGNNVDTVRATVRADLVEQTLRRLLGKRFETRLDDYFLGVQLVSHRGTRRMAPRTGGQIPVQLVRLDPMVNRPTVHPEPRRQCGTGTIGADIDPADIYSRFHDGRDGLTDALGRLLDFLVAQMGVTQRRAHIGMTEQPGDDRHRHAIHDRVTGMGMPEIV